MTRRSRTRNRIQKHVPASSLAKSWLMAQPDFKEMMDRFVHRFAEQVVSKFHDPSAKTLDDLLVGNLLVFWNGCDDDVLGQAMLAAVRGLER